MSLGARIDDNELRAVVDGWRCPGCGRSAVTFFGLAPERRCRRCEWAAQRPDVLAEIELGRRVAGAIA